MSITLKNICLVINAVLWLSPLALADEEDTKKHESCKVDDTASTHRMASPNVPGYFFRPFATQPMVSYASAEKNYMLGLYDGKENQIPGIYDPVPTPDEKFMTVPQKREGLKIYDLEGLKNGNNKPLLSDPTLTGVYQSIGTVSEQDGRTVYRIITDKDGLSFRDYEATHSNPPVIKPLGDGPKRLCKGMDLSMPMLSKNGKQLAALDVAKSVTKIYDIDPVTLECKESLNLGIPTGKVDFGFNHDDLTFHVLNNNTYGSYYFENPEDEMAANVYSLKRSTGELKRLTYNTDSNSNYPAFRRDGTIVYMNHPKNRGTSSEPSYFVVADPSKATGIPFELVQKGTCQGQPAEHLFNSIAAVGALWAQVCSAFGGEISGEAAALNLLSLNREKCVKLVEDEFEKQKSKMLENQYLVESGRVKKEILSQLKIEDLLAVCPESDFKPIIDDLKRDKEDGNGAPVPEACLECHMGSIPFNDPEALRTKKAKSGKPFIEEIWTRIHSKGEDKMPPDREISEKERAAFEAYLIRVGAKP